jgi:hypothetical protein
MADSSSSNKEQELVIVVPVGLPPELHQCAPEFFLVVDSSATVHCLWDATYLLRISENKTHQLDGEVSIHVQYALLLATYVA